MGTCPRGQAVDGDQILAILALHLNVDLVAVTVMTTNGVPSTAWARMIPV